MKNVGVKVEKNLDRALKIFRERVKNSQILTLYKEKQEYIKPSVKKRKSLLKSIKKQKFNNNNMY